MAKRRIVWRRTEGNPAPDRDVHVLRGFSSRDLIDDLRFRDEEDEAAEDAEIDKGQIVFQPLFKGDQNGDLWENPDLGISVNTKTGEVIPDPPAAEPFDKVKNNFILEIRGVAPAFETTNTEVIRVHVHMVVANVWLTPPTLTIRPSGVPLPELTRSRFTVHALFDTGITGDLTLNHGVRWKTAPPADPIRNVAASGWLRIDSADVPPVDIEITATLPAALGDATTPPAKLQIRPAWQNDLDPPRARIVAGSAHAGELWEGTILPERVPNVLVVSDGFRGGPLGDGDAFDAIVDKIVHHLKTDWFTRPFDLLATSMNFWKVFSSSDAVGISVRSEVYSYVENGLTWAELMPQVEKPPEDKSWTIENLLYAAGLPTPGDLSDENGDLKKPADFRNEWSEVVEADFAKASDDVIEEWMKMAMGRGFIEQFDTFPGMSLGVPPAANSADHEDLDLHEDHGGKAALQAFYKTLAAAPAANGTVIQTGDGKPIGDLWLRKIPAYDFDNRELVILISSTKGGRAVNHHDYIAMSRESSDPVFSIQMIPGRTDFQLDPETVDADIDADVFRTAAHELGHSFGLGDEYRDIRRAYPHPETRLEDVANLQTEADVQVEVPDAGGGTKKVFDGGRIKWNWHRIRKAAVISDRILEAGDAFRVPLETGQGKQFQVGDRVMLRLRIPGTPLGKGPRTFGDKTKGQELQIVEQPEISQLVLPGDVESYKRGDLQYIGAAAGSTVTFAGVQDFRRGSVLYIPTPAAATVPASHPYAELVAWNIKEHITAKNKPLTPRPCVLETESDAAKKKIIAQWPILDDVKIRAVWAYKIVGLYAGGAHYACGIFHPTGWCMMRRSRFDHSAFCAVCRYVLVDMINPYHHFAIERDHAEDDPQPLSNENP
jgi:hypothetical protein